MQEAEDIDGWAGYLRPDLAGVEKRIKVPKGDARGELCGRGIERGLAEQRWRLGWAEGRPRKEKEARNTRRRLNRVGRT
jgi:hypothetical protein